MYMCIGCSSFLERFGIIDQHVYRSLSLFCLSMNSYLTLLTVSYLLFRKS